MDITTADIKQNKEFALRPFRESDIPLFTNWLRQDHVAVWYERPREWLDEVNDRDGEFSFIRHYIAEFDNKPIGFGQYYEYRLGGEVWHGNTDINGAYSIDYLIGDTDYLGKGLGRAIIIALVNELVRNEAAKSVIVQPSPDNKASCGALIACGFTLDTVNGLYRLDLCKLSLSGNIFLWEKQ